MGYEDVDVFVARCEKEDLFAEWGVDGCFDAAAAAALVVVVAGDMGVWFVAWEVSLGGCLRGGEDYAGCWGDDDVCFFLGDGLVWLVVAVVSVDDDGAFICSFKTLN